MNMLVVDLNLPNPKEPFVLPVIDVIDLDLSDLGLEEVFVIDDQLTVEEDDVLREW